MTISHDVTVDLATVAISIDAIATDDVINAAEKGRIWCCPAPPLTWRNQTVYITFGGKSYRHRRHQRQLDRATVPSG